MTTDRRTALLNLLAKEQARKAAAQRRWDRQYTYDTDTALEQAKARLRYLVSFLKSTYPPL